MGTLSEMIILRWLLIISQFLFAFIVPIIITKQKGKGYQGIKATDEAFEYENIKSLAVLCFLETPVLSFGFIDELVRYSGCKKCFRISLQMNNKMITKYKLFQINFEEKLV